MQNIILQLQSSNTSDREKACDELRKASHITPEEFIALQNALHDSSGWVIEAAKKALAAHPSPDLPPEQIYPEPPLEAKGDIQKWEHRWEFVFLEGDEYVIIVKERKIVGRVVWNYLSSLGNYGWELVSVAPQIGDTNPQRDKSSNPMASLVDFAIAGPRVTTMSQHMTGTTGYFFWYKRPM